MPQAILAVAPYVAGALGASKAVVAAVAIVAAVASVALTAQEQKQAQGAAKRRERSYPRNATIRSGVVPQNIVYGRAQVGGPLVYANTVHSAGSTNNTDLWIVQALAGHEVDDIEDVWVDDKHTTDAQITSGAGGAVLSGSPFYNGGALAYFYRKFGTASQTALSELVTAFPSDITSTFRGRGIAYIVCRFILANNSRFMFKGVPSNIRALVKGKKVYDPRKDPTQASYGGSGAHDVDDSSTWEWSESPPLCLADYLMDTRFGMSVPAARIDWDLVADSADYCATLVAIPGSTTEQRFTCNGVVSTGVSHAQNIEAILSSMGGMITYSGGKFRIRASMWEASSGTITDDDIGDNVRYRPNNTQDERFNTIRATIFDKARDYQELDAGEISAVTA